MQATSPAAAARSMIAELRHKIQSRTAQCGVVGLGYVGLPLAVEIGRSGFSVVGIDRDASKVERARRGDSWVDEVEPSRLRHLGANGQFAVDVNEEALSHCDTVSVCVPTPLRKTKDPDMSFIVEATESLAAHLHPGMLIVLESTTYPGTTEELILPMLERPGLRVGKDFFLCFSPERVDPGNPRFQTRNIPKVIGGMTPQCRELGTLFYSQIMDCVVPVSSTRVAEMVKLLENTFRMINIGLANEMALMCDRMDIDVWEVIEAAATKPFGFMPFYPGPGLGGHCIPVDPHYLMWKTKQVGHDPRFIELAAHINGSMPKFVVAKIQAALNDTGKPVKGSRVHVVGVAYKRDVGDTRESPAVDILEMLRSLGAVVSYSDPFVPRLSLGAGTMNSEVLEATAPRADCVVIITDHSAIDYHRLVAISPLIVDTRNILKGIHSDKIVRL